MTREFKIEPFRMWKSGEPRKTPVGTPLEGDYAETYWCAKLCHVVDASGEPLPVALNRFARELRTHKEFLLNVREAGGRAELYVGLHGPGSYGFEFVPGLLAELASIELALALEVYAVPQNS
jgi:hypothetical protein